MKKESKIKITTEKKIHRLTIPLNPSGEQDPLPIRWGDLSIEQRKWLIDALMSSLPRDSYSLRLHVVPDPCLVIPELDKLLQISILGRKGSCIENLTINSHRTDYVLLFDPTAVKDCRIVQTESTENDSFSISYELALYHKEEKWTSVEGEIILTLKRIDAVEPGFSFIPMKDRIEFRRESMQVGTLRIWNQGSFFRTPALNVSFSLDALLGEEPIEGLVTLGDSAVVHNGRPALNPFLEDPLGGIIDVLGDCDTFSNAGGACQIRHLCVNPSSQQDEVGGLHCFDVPVFLHLDRMDNPYTDTEIVLQIASRSCLYYQTLNNQAPILRKEVGRIVLLKNRRVTDLDVSADDGSEHVVHFKRSGESHLFNAEFFGWTEGEDVPYLYYRFSIANRAEVSDPTRPGAGVWISGLTIGPPEAENGCSILFIDGRSMLDGLFEWHAFPSEMKLSDGRPPFALDILYTDAFIDQMLDADGQTLYNMTVNIPVEFSYWIDRTGAGDAGVAPEYDFFRTVLRFQIYKRARPEWLCLDFGTSAIVASYTDHLGDDEDRLIRLQDMKDSLMQRVFPGPNAERSREDAPESSVYLISSAAVLRNTNLAASLAGDPDVYGDKAVWLSPPSIGYAEYYNQLLPCLKSIVGNGSLPMEMIPVGIRQGMAPGASVSVDAILKLIYSEFFHLFLPEEAKATERLIMSFPNTFSPMHIAKIKERAIESLDSLRPDYLRFISESDAVAFYYNAHRDEFMEGARDLIKGREDAFDRHVLVFDMGAGTLDLTYFTRECVPNERGTVNTRITICGKMGVNKAGNYLDYVLAEILVDKLCSRPGLEDFVGLLKNLVRILPSDDLEEAVSMRDAASLKAYVKNTVKLMLDGSPQMTLPLGLTLFGRSISQVQEISVGDIVSDPRFGDFLDSVSRGVFEHFVSLFGNGDPGAKLPVDLLLFSGRTTGLLHLRRKVSQALDVLTPNPEQCLFADLSSHRFVDVDAPVGDVTGLKTVVVDGSLSFCMGINSFELVNRNVYATYGVLLKHQNGRTIWLPLIDYRTQPVSTSPLSRDGITISEYDTRVHRAVSDSDVDPQNVDLSSFSEILLVQSYCKDTLQSWLDGKTELISVLGGIRLDGSTARVSQIRLVINSENQLTLFIGNQPRKLSPHDNYEDETFAKSMWPVIRIGG